MTRSSSEALLGGLSHEEFLHEYWQKKPLLVRGAFPSFESPISPEDLAGLALEEEAESRIIIERGGSKPWELRHGPFEEEDFAALPETHWTLLVQEVDQWVPDIADLLEHFRFLPRWRIDDVMVSYAPDGGNVGAHIDNYDVFLLQAAGKREWRIASQPVHQEELVSGLDVRVLANFEADQTWILEPGDMLYLPPRIPHHGIAVGECMTFSIGFRAPSHAEVIATILGAALDEADIETLYADPDMEPAEHPALIGPDAVVRIRRILDSQLTDAKLLRWFGELVTEPKRGEFVIPADEKWSVEALREAVVSGAALDRVDPNRFAFAPLDDGSALLFAHGEAIEVDRQIAQVAPLISGDDPLDAHTLADFLQDEAFAKLLARLVNDGHLIIDDH